MCFVDGASREFTQGAQPSIIALMERALTAYLSGTFEMSNEMTNERMTCQICGRKILAKNGKIAHHGYQRPGDGEQTQSCGGARHLPLEVSNLVLADHVAGIEKNVVRLTKFIDEEIVEVRRVVKKRDSKTWAITYSTLVFNAENYVEMLKLHNRHVEYPRHFSNADAVAYWTANYGEGSFEGQTESYRMNESMEGRERARRLGLLKIEVEYLEYQAARLHESTEILGGVK